LAMNVTVSGRSGLRNTYRSVLSAIGSWLMRGASRWLDAAPGSIWTAMPNATADTTINVFFTALVLLVGQCSVPTLASTVAAVAWIGGWRVVDWRAESRSVHL